ncbi:hypothetical protein MIMGU_mgv1a017253mg [Erythranthe guttata]|uniref:Uncharacterized protein n=1 Tax=Erythranthe guttata TaxID=4155 RepID=A0A022QHJ6_ERYGU|nr:hypothetical protein MIMGU_mgv1a017253mg [Erythranthe guttata]
MQKQLKQNSNINCVRSGGRMDILLGTKLSNVALFRQWSPPKSCRIYHDQLSAVWTLDYALISVMINSEKKKKTELLILFRFGFDGN